MAHLGQDPDQVQQAMQPQDPGADGYAMGFDPQHDDGMQAHMTGLDPALQQQIANMAASGQVPNETFLHLLKNQNQFRGYGMMQQMGQGQVAMDQNTMFMILGKQNQPMQQLGGGAVALQQQQHLAQMGQAETTQSGRKRRKGDDDEEDTGRQRKKGVDEKRQRMQCWNCSPDCPNLSAGPERHYVAGMCGRCHQRWMKHPDARWSVTMCVSKCRCERCDYNRAMNETMTSNPSGPSTVATPSEALMVTYQAEVDNFYDAPAPDFSMVPALYALAAPFVEDQTRLLDTVPEPSTEPSDEWPVVLIVDGKSHAAGKVLAASEQAKALFNMGDVSAGLVVGIGGQNQGPPELQALTAPGMEAGDGAPCTPDGSAAAIQTALMAHQNGAQEGGGQAGEGHGVTGTGAQDVATPPQSEGAVSRILNKPLYKLMPKGQILQHVAACIKGTT